ncbi:predicted protein [Nematostella vectensis]|uniref:G-protein coupled receptors family 1 profile domain-containing protein n=2 Tax=Nematostella vectensis TaxID=45351 RepID=A7SE73_NEMVE|nr:predicted protein [Nematostella vectensis]|eukprot:XP_001630051.1 predicted protein [Nematostella vectensis]
MYTSPNLYTARLQKYGTSYKCLTVWAPLDHYTSATVHVVVMVVLFMFIPWLLVATLYLVMVSEIRKSKREVAQRSRQRNRDLRVLKLALTITAAFAVCNFPICALYLLIAFKYQWNTCFLPEVWGPLFNTAKYLVLASTCLNPCICFAFSENFRKGLRELTRAQRSFITTIVTHSRRANSTAFSHIEGEHEMLYEMKENGITENGNKNAIDYSPSQSLRE